MAVARKKEAPETRPSCEAQRIHDLVSPIYTDLVQHLMVSKAEDTVTKWLSKAKAIDETSSDRLVSNAMILAAEIELFTPSLNGTTALDRFARQPTVTEADKEAFALLRGARFTLLRILAVDGDKAFTAEDCVTGVDMSGFDPAASSMPVGLIVAARLVLLPDGTVVPIGLPTPIDEAALAVGLEFVRPGKGIINENRCAAAVYKHVVRHGGPRIPGMNVPPEGWLADDADADSKPDPDPLDLLLLPWIDLDDDKQPVREIVDAVRALASVDSVLATLHKAAIARSRDMDKVVKALCRMTQELMATLVQRAHVGTGGDINPLETVARAIDHEIATSGYPRAAAALFEALRKTLAPRIKPKQNDDALTRVIERIRALRSKTVDQGCTEEEAIAAANKAAELLDRYGLSLSEIDIRQQTCEGIGIESTRKRSGPLDECFPAVATFCDCKAWRERSAAGTIRSVFFGLPADVEAARFIYERVTVTFETETAAFQAGDFYRSAPGGSRRTATTSFQLGLARGICAKLKALRADRETSFRSLSGRDLVTFKSAVIDEDLARLGLTFTTTTPGRNRLIFRDAYEAGEVAGRQFEARTKIEG